MFQKKQVVKSKSTVGSCVLQTCIFLFTFLHCLFLLIVVLLIFFYIFAYMLMKGKIILGIKYVDEILRNQNVNMYETLCNYFV